MPDLSQFERQVLDGLAELKDGLAQLRDQGASHNTDIALIKERLGEHHLMLRGPDGQSGALHDLSMLQSFRSTLTAFAVVGAGIWALITVLAGVALTSWLDSQAKLREAAHLQEMQSIVSKIDNRNPASARSSAPAEVAR